MVTRAMGNRREIFEHAHLKLTVSGQSKQTSIDTHTLPQCSHASVGLAQARPNNNFTTNWVVYNNTVVGSWLRFSIAL